MGIIISSFIGCGKTHLFNSHGDKIKMMDASNLNIENIVDEVISIVGDNDIIFIPIDKDVREKFNQANIDYDVFYPSKERRREFIEKQVVKRSNPNDIRNLDKNFDKWVDEIDNDEHKNVYKHKLNESGQFIGNSQIIMTYIESINAAQKNVNNKIENSKTDEQV